MNAYIPIIAYTKWNVYFNAASCYLNVVRDPVTGTFGLYESEGKLTSESVLR